MVAGLPRYRYRVDRVDKLIWVDRLWLAFAQENGAADLTQRSVLGRPLWEFVQGEETRRLYQEIHARVRAEGKPVVLPFRCDSPTLQRHMRLTITREKAGQLHYDSIVLRVQTQCCLGILDAEQAKSKAFLTMCSCCKRVLVESTGWLYPEEVSIRLRLFEAATVPELRQTICPECASAARQAIANGSGPAA